jgi:hypothetical protein
MNIPSRSVLIATAILLIAPVITPHGWAQTPAQMEYERQQREYRQQQERQRQEQQQLQQLMNENARRQQEESRRLNTPMGQSATPSYQSATPQQMAPRQPGARTDATASTAAAKWVKIDSSPFGGGRDVYADSVTIVRSGNTAKMWDMRDFKTAQVVQGTRFLSFKAQFEYDCKSARMRNLSVIAFSGHMGEGHAERSENTRLAWEAVAPGSTEEALLKVACGKK